MSSVIEGALRYGILGFCCALTVPEIFLITWRPINQNSVVHYLLNLLVFILGYVNYMVNESTEFTQITISYFWLLPLLLLSSVGNHIKNRSDKVIMVLGVISQLPLLCASLILGYEEKWIRIPVMLVGFLLMVHSFGVTHTSDQSRWIPRMMFFCFAFMAITNLSLMFLVADELIFIPLYWQMASVCIVIERKISERRDRDNDNNNYRREYELGKTNGTTDDLEMILGNQQARNSFVLYLQQRRCAEILDCYDKLRKASSENDLQELQVNYIDEEGVSAQNITGTLRNELLTQLSQNNLLPTTKERMLSELKLQLKNLIVEWRSMQSSMRSLIQ